jgi:hypothetical protein
MKFLLGRKKISFSRLLTWQVSVVTPAASVCTWWCVPAHAHACVPSPVYPVPHVHVNIDPDAPAMQALTAEATVWHGSDPAGHADCPEQNGVLVPVK